MCSNARHTRTVHVYCIVYSTSTCILYSVQYIVDRLGYYAEMQIIFGPVCRISKKYVNNYNENAEENIKDAEEEIRDAE